MVLRARTATATLCLVAHLDCFGVFENASETVTVVDFKLVLGDIASGNKASGALVAHAGEHAVTRGDENGEGETWAPESQCGRCLR